VAAGFILVYVFDVGPLKLCWKICGVLMMASTPLTDKNCALLFSETYRRAVTVSNDDVAAAQHRQTRRGEARRGGARMSPARPA
jgi:hypothetical protein